MIPSAPSPVAGSQPAQVQTAQKAAQPPSPETARASAGETAASKIRLETADALKAPEQARVAARLRDQETAEQTERVRVERPAGPPPAFEESPLERQARVALEPQEPENEAATPEVETDTKATTDKQDTLEPSQPVEAKDTAASATQRAEASFAETKTLQSPGDGATVDVAR